MQRSRVSRLKGLATSGTAAAGRGATTPGASQPSGMGPQIRHYLGTIWVWFTLVYHKNGDDLGMVYD